MKWLGTLLASVAFGLPAIAFLVALVLGEAVALWVLAGGSSNQLQLSITTAGAVALVAAIPLPVGDETAR